MFQTCDLPHALKLFEWNKACFFLHISNVLGLCRGVLLHALYAEACPCCLPPSFRFCSLERDSMKTSDTPFFQNNSPAPAPAPLSCLYKEGRGASTTINMVLFFSIQTQNGCTCCTHQKESVKWTTFDPFLRRVSLILMFFQEELTSLSHFPAI